MAEEQVEVVAEEEWEEGTCSPPPTGQRSGCQSLSFQTAKHPRPPLKLISLSPPAGPRHHQPSGQHLPGGAEGQVARDAAGVRARRRRGLLLHHQAAGQRQQPERGPLGLTAGVKGDQACCRKQGVLSQSQRRMLISPESPPPPRRTPPAPRSAWPNRSRPTRCRLVQHVSSLPPPLWC